METLKILSTIYLSTYLLAIPGKWYVFEKLGIAPWKSIIPIYSTIVLMLFFDISMWFLLLLLFPYALMLLEFIIGYKISRSFDQNIGFAIGLTFWFTKPIFISILGFGKYQFIGKEGMV